MSLMFCGCSPPWSSEIAVLSPGGWGFVPRDDVSLRVASRDGELPAWHPPDRRRGRDASLAELSTLTMEDLVTHSGRCHCGAVRFEFDAHENLVVWNCNCSICAVKKNTHVIVPESRFRLLQGVDRLSTYQARWASAALDLAAPAPARPLCVASSVCARHRPLAPPIDSPLPWPGPCSLARAPLGTCSARLAAFAPSTGPAPTQTATQSLSAASRAQRSRA